MAEGRIVAEAGADKLVYQQGAPATSEGWPLARQ
jgi:hypothetical protein